MTMVVGKDIEELKAMSAGYDTAVRIAAAAVAGDADGVGSQAATIREALGALSSDANATVPGLAPRPCARL